MNFTFCYVLTIVVLYSYLLTAVFLEISYLVSALEFQQFLYLQWFCFFPNHRKLSDWNLI